MRQERERSARLAGDDVTAQRAVARGVAPMLYAVVTVLMLLQQPGRTTYDTRAELTERPADFLGGAFRLWHPESNFGEFQNQAYGYLFPQGTWFWLTDLFSVPDWISQRLWSALILIVACEGARRVARVVGLGPVAGLVAGVAFAFSPRLLGTVPVQTAESLPGAVMPWLVLPVMLHLRGQLPGRAAALLSGAAVVCMGGVNAVETAACLPLAAILVLWGARTGSTSWRWAAGWSAAVGLACLWWTLPLFLLARYAPPFYAYVESARDTTSLIGWSEAARGDSSWLGYLLTGDQPWWPAAFALATEPVLIIVAALVAGVGLAGLVRLDSPVRRPLALAALLGLGCLTIAHGGLAGSPLADPVRALLDGPLQIFRNVHKVDPIVRLPLALGFAAAVAGCVDLLVRARPRLAESRPALLLVPIAVVALLLQPFVANSARTPGWEEISTPWQQARSYLLDVAKDRPAAAVGATLVVPGSSFAQQDWGWTLDEPLAVQGGVETVSRSQIPLVPGETIRYLAALDQAIVTGRVTLALVGQLARAGIRHVVLRRDLLRGLTRSPHPGGAAVSLSHAGLQRVAGFGASPGEAAEVEIFRVPDALAAVRLTPLTDVVTVRGTAESVLLAQDTDLVDPHVATVLEGEPGWEEAAALVTDSDQRRERAFGNNDEGISALMTATDPWRVERAVHDFPGGPAAASADDQVVARYAGLKGLTASSAQGYADNFGPVQTASGPGAAIDGDPDTQWITSAAGDPEEQWIRLEFDRPRPVHRVDVSPVADDTQVVPIRVLEVRAGDQRVRLRVNASGAPATARFDGSSVGDLEVRVIKAGTAAGAARVGLRDISVDTLDPHRTAVLPGVVPADAALAFSVVPGRRACFVTFTVPDCSVTRIRQAEEGGDLDRTFTLERAATMEISGHVVVRNTPEAALLLDQVEQRPPVSVTSSYGQDTKVAGRFAYDGQSTTAWVSDDADLYPTMTFRWNGRPLIDGLTVHSGGSEQAPVAAVVTANGRSQRVTLTGDGPVELAPVRAKTLQVRFEKAPGARHVVVPEIELSGVDVTRPFIAQAPTGAVCGFGPQVEVDGEMLSTRVSGTFADLINGTPLAFEACSLPDGDAAPASADRAVAELARGERHLRVSANAEFEVLDVALTPTGDRTATAAGRSVRVEEWDDHRRTVHVAPGAEALLSMPQNHNPGWIAELDGQELTPIRVDGWQQGWVVPSGAGGSIELRYGPQRTYGVVLPAGLALSGLVLVGGMICLGGLAVRRRTPKARPWPHDDAPKSGRWRAGGWVAAAVLLGPVAALAFAAGALFRHRSTALLVLVAVSTTASGVVDVVADGTLAFELADVLAGVGVGLFAGLLVSREPSRHRAREVAA